MEAQGREVPAGEEAADRHPRGARHTRTLPGPGRLRGTARLPGDRPGATCSHMGSLTARVPEPHLVPGAEV